MVRVPWTGPLYARHTLCRKGTRTPYVRPMSGHEPRRSRRHHPRRRGRRADAHLPRRQPDRRRLRAARRRLRARRRCACSRRSSPTSRSSTSGCPTARASTCSRRVRAADGVASRIDPEMPLIVLTGRAGELDRVRGFERGCRRLRRASRSPTASCARGSRRCCAAPTSAARPGRLRVGELELDPAVARGAPARRGGSTLSQKEFALLRALAAEPTRVFTKEELLRDVWGFRSLGTTRTLDSHACRLRHKLGARRRPLRRQRLGRRLPAGRRPVARA